MRRVNLIVSEELRALVIVHAALRFEGVVARAAANGVTLGCEALMSAPERTQATAAVNTVKGIYPLLKAGTSPRIVMYIDEIDKSLFQSAARGFALHPRSRAYRIALAVGLGGMAAELSAAGAAESALLTQLSKIGAALETRAKG